MLVLRGDQRRPVHTGEQFPPVPPRLLPVLLGHPGQVVPVRGHPRQHGLVATRAVEREQLLGQQRIRPPVQHEVVAGHDEPVPVAAKAYQREPGQRCLCQVESPHPVVLGQPVEFGRAPRIVQTGQIVLRPRQRGFPYDHLDRFVQAVHGEPGPEVDVPAQQRRRG